MSRRRLRPIWKFIFSVSTSAAILTGYVHSLPVHANYESGTLTALAKLKHVDTSDPVQVRNLVLDYTASQNGISADKIDYKKSTVSVTKPDVVKTTNLESAVIDVSLKEISTDSENKEKNEEAPKEEVQATTQPQLYVPDVPTGAPAPTPTAVVVDDTAKENTSAEQAEDNTAADETTTDSTSDSNEDISDKDNTSSESVPSKEEVESVKEIADANIVSETDDTQQKQDLTLLLKTDETTVWNGGKFNPELMVSSIIGTNGKLPVLSIDSNVDTSKDGTYTVKYKAVDITGKSVEASLKVNVKTPDEVIQKQIEEKKKQEEAEREARRQQVQAAASSNASLNIGAPAVDGKIASMNPYPLAGGYWTNCTWSAWQMVYQNEGIKLPKWGNAAEWYYNAIASGYSVDSNPKVGDVAVYGGNGLGHVAYVSEVSPDGNFVYVQQGNWAGSYSENWNSRYGSAGGMRLLGYIHVK